VRQNKDQLDPRTRLNFCRQEEINASRRDVLGVRLSFPVSRFSRPADPHRQLHSEASGCAALHDYPHAGAGSYPQRSKGDGMESVRRVPCPRANMMSGRRGPSAGGVLEGICRTKSAAAAGLAGSGMIRAWLLAFTIGRTALSSFLARKRVNEYDLEK
jgi:hypothetical protein